MKTYSAILARTLCASILLLNLTAGAPLAVLADETSTEDYKPPVLRSTIIQTHRPTVNLGDVRVVAAETALELVLLKEIAADEAEEGDEFFGKVNKDVLVDGQVVIPKGTLLHGVLNCIQEPKRAGRNGFINTHFDYLITPDGREVPIEGDSTTRNSKSLAAAKVVGRAAGFTAIGGLVGTLLVLKYGGIAAAAASHGTALAGGAAIGGGAGLTIAMLTKGKSVMLEPGTEMKVILSEPLKLPTIIMPEETADDYSFPGLEVKIMGIHINHHEITLTLDISNQTENTFSTFDIGLEDELGNVFFRSPIGDTGKWISKIEPNSHFNRNITFSVDNAKIEHKLVFFKPYSRDALAKFALTQTMLASAKSSVKKSLKGQIVSTHAHHLK